MKVVFFLLFVCLFCFVFPHPLGHLSSRQPLDFFLSIWFSLLLFYFLRQNLFPRWKTSFRKKWCDKAFRCFQFPPMSVSKPKLNTKCKPTLVMYSFSYTAFLSKKWSFWKVLPFFFSYMLLPNSPFYDTYFTSKTLFIKPFSLLKVSSKVTCKKCQLSIFSPSPDLSHSVPQAQASHSKTASVTVYPLHTAVSLLCHTWNPSSNPLVS